MPTRGAILTYVRKKFGTEPEYPWARYPHYAVLRHQQGRKWYALIMDVPPDRLGLDGDGPVEIINLKSDGVLDLLNVGGFDGDLPGGLFGELVGEGLQLEVVLVAELLAVAGLSQRLEDGGGNLREIEGHLTPITLDNGLDHRGTLSQTVPSAGRITQRATFSDVTWVKYDTSRPPVKPYMLCPPRQYTRCSVFSRQASPCLLYTSDAADE